ncbi:MAG: phytanoyl-CoA dioxygenase family protein, partial [Elusimicrobia bacterium]|nr:phytanoyl-CoA dioxygenase family protein [Elusimicrobiota bacterium]
MMPALTATQLEYYAKNGYLVVERLFTAAECDAVHEAIAAHADGDFAAIMNPDREDFLSLQSPIRSKEAIRRTVKIMRDVMRDRRIVDIIETIYGGREAVGLMSQVLFKKANSPYASQA